MRIWRNSAWAAIGAAAVLLADPGALSAAPCDEYDPAAPVRTARITLSASDANEARIVQIAGPLMRAILEGKE